MKHLNNGQGSSGASEDSPTNGTMHYMFPTPTSPSIFISSCEVDEAPTTHVFSRYKMLPFYGTRDSLPYSCVEQAYHIRKAELIENYQLEINSEKLCEKIKPKHEFSPDELAELDDLSLKNLRSKIYNSESASLMGAYTEAFDIDAHEEASREWEEMEPHVLYCVNMYKYESCADARAFLLGTGSRELVEASEDRIKGIGCIFSNGEFLERERELWGLNLHGKALMQARHEIRANLALDPHYYDYNDSMWNMAELPAKELFQEAMFDLQGLSPCKQQHDMVIQKIKDAAKSTSRKRKHSELGIDQQGIDQTDTANRNGLEATTVAPENSSSANNTNTTPVFAVDPHSEHSTVLNQGSTDMGDCNGTCGAASTPQYASNLTSEATQPSQQNYYRVGTPRDMSARRNVDRVNGSSAATPSGQENAGLGGNSKRESIYDNTSDANFLGIAPSEFQRRIDSITEEDMRLAEEISVMFHVT